MADTPLSSQMESEYKVAKWNRSTVADGSWLQKYTIEKLKDRDIFLANHIDSNTDDLLAKLEAEIEARKEGDNYISATINNVSSDFYTFSGNVETSAANITNTINVFSGKVEQSAYNLSTALNFEVERAQETENNLAKEIDKIKAATDVIAVFGTYDEFTAASASEWQQTVTDQDFVKVLRDSAYNPDEDPDADTPDDDYYQVYYEWHDITHADWTGWSAIGNLDPYYSVAETDEIISDLSSTISDNYLSANGDAVQSGHNIVITKPDGDNTPHIKIETSSHVTFDGVSSTDLTATNASGTNLKYDFVTAINLSSTAISAKDLTATNVYSDYVSSISSKTDYLTANSAKGWSANYMTGSFTYLGGVNVTAGDFTATQAKISGLSALNISGNGKSSTVSGLILSSQSGAYASAVLNSAYWSATNGTNGNSGLIGNSFVISAGANLGLSVDGSAIKISGTPAGVTSISAKDTNVNTNFTGGTVTLSAGPNIDFVTVDTNTLGIKLEDSIYWSGGVSNNYTTFNANFSSLEIKRASQHNGSEYVSFSGDALNLNKTNASQSEGTSSATLNSRGVSAFDSQAGTAQYYRTWIDIISGSNLQDGNYVYIDRTLNTVNLSPNISANNISAGTSITFPGDSTHSALLNATGLGFSSKNTYGTVSAYYGVDYMYLSAGGRPGSDVKISPTNFIASYMSESYEGLWKNVASASKLTGSNFIGITTSNIDSLYHITLSSNISALYLSAYNINQEYYDNSYTARLSSNADSVEMWQHTQGQPGNTTGIAKWAYIIRNNETRNGTMAKMNSGDYISGNGTITAMVSASTIGTDPHVLYLV